MNLRQLDKGDWRLWKDIRLEALQNSPESFLSSYEEECQWTDADFQRELSREYILAVFIDDLLVACAGFYILKLLKTKHRGVLWGMYTRPQYRGKGIAKALIQAIIQHAKTSVMQLHLTCVTSNHVAVAFYQKQGFKIYGTEPRALKVNNSFYNEHLMVLDLSGSEVGIGA